MSKSLFDMLAVSRPARGDRRPAPALWGTKTGIVSCTLIYGIIKIYSREVPYK